MFDDFWNTGSTTREPACDCQDTGSHYIYSFDLPGFKKEDVKIEIQENAIHVSGERKREREDTKKGQFTSERFYGSMERWLPLPGNVKNEGIEAHMENGVLQVAIPKSEQTQAKQITIGDGKTGVFAKSSEEKPAA